MTREEAKTLFFRATNLVAARHNRTALTREEFDKMFVNDGYSQEEEYVFFDILADVVDIALEDHFKNNQY